MASVRNHIFKHGLVFSIKCEMKLRMLEAQEMHASFMRKTRLYLNIKKQREFENFIAKYSFQFDSKFSFAYVFHLIQRTHLILERNSLKENLLLVYKFEYHSNKVKI